MSAKTLSFIWLLLPLIGWIIRQQVPLFRNHRVWFFLGIVLFGSLIIVKTSRLSGAEMKQKMDQYDLDGNGVFSGWEMTPEAKAAIQNYATDTGRSFAPFTAGPMTAIWTGFWFSLFSGTGWLWRKMLPTKAAA